MDVEKAVYRSIAGLILAAMVAAAIASLDDIRREIRIMRM